jgi:hypothetical protein
MHTGLFKGVYRGITPVILASPFQGALFFGTKDTIKKALPMLGVLFVPVKNGH